MEPTPWSGVAYRHTSPGREPLSGEGARQFGGRWNPPERFPTLYLASSVASCLAEFERMAAGQASGTQSFLPRDLHEINVENAEVFDLTLPESLENVGLSASTIQDDDRGPCQDVGDVAHFLNFQGVRASSATGVDVALALFELKVRPSQLKLLRTSQLPAT